ncbi:MAG: hypothetical protein ACK5XN_05010 [Bacteroidota bacterium]
MDADIVFFRWIMDKTEALCRMWVLCDPNRDHDGLDDPMAFDNGSNLNGKPRWHWFIPRAEASEKFLLEAGFRIVPV